MDAFTRAATNRSLRTIKTELDFLLDASVLTPAQVSQIAAILPASAASSSSAAPTPAPPTATAASPPPAASAPSPLNEKQQPPFSAPSPAPPSYAASPPPGLASAESLYHYQPTDAGDLALAPGERVVVLEWMNADWARGRSEKTGAEGIFPRAYVRVLDEKSVAGMPPPLPPVQGMNNMNLNQSGGGYGNMPVEVAQGQQQQGDSRFNQQGKKFGKKLGNAAIFGAGATIGSNIVSGIF